MISKEFKEAYKRLNKKQKEAVDTIDGPVLVIAGPGTGKTTILAMRIANILIKTDTPPSAILALTFTEAGSRSMKEKLRSIIGNRALEIAIHTFHSFARSVISEFPDHFPLLSRSTQITEVDSEIILRDILKQKKFAKIRPLGDPDFYIGKILDAISDCKQEAWTPEMIGIFAREEIERIKNDETYVSKAGKSKGTLKGEALRRIEKCERTVIFAEVYDEYERRKREEKKIDFDDLIFALVETLRQDKLLLQLLQEKYLYILVDEHQDTNDSQNMLLKMIADFFESPNLFVVGDEKQAIYRFQGASVENFLMLRRSWGNMKIISLEDNYRSHQKILDASHCMIEKNYKEGEHNDLRVKLRSKSPESRPIEIMESPDTDTEIREIARRIFQIQESEQDKTVAVILRKNSEVSRVMSILSSYGVSASAERGANIFEHPIGRAFFALIGFLANPDQTESLAQTFASGMWGLSFDKQVSLIKFARSGKIAEIEKQIKEIKELLKEIPHSGAVKYLSVAAETSGLEKIASESPAAAEVWRAIFDLAKDIAQSEGIEDPRALMEALLSYKKSSEKKVIKMKTGMAESNVIILTAHSSKGLEYDYVFIPLASEEHWMSKARGTFFILPREKEALDDERDERRLFYVALTRAREHIVISYSLKDSLDKTFTPLRFIDELEEASITRTYLNELPKVESTGPKKVKRNRSEEKVEFTKNVLLDSGLSVTALNHFIRCPNEFFFKSILKLPEPPTASSEKGNAMHEAISRVWQFIRRNPTPSPLPLSRGGGGKKEYPSFPSPLQGEGKGGVEKMIENILIKSVKEYFEKSLLASYEKEAVVDELVKNAPKVALALLEHFRQKGSISTEGWFETYFKVKVKTTSSKKNDVELRLHGKIDAIVDSGDLAYIYDYKTREAMNEKAIRGESASGGRDYFRQLVYYKILLEENPRFKNRKIFPSLVFVKPDRKERCPTVTLSINEKDIEEVREEISSLIESVWSGEFLDSKCLNPSCKYCSILLK